MNIKKVITTIFLISLAGTIFYMFNIRVTPIDDTCFNFYTSENNEIYYMEGTDNQVLYKLNSNEEIVEKIKLNSYKNTYFNSFIVDEYKDIYFVASETDKVNNISLDCIKIYRAAEKQMETLYIANDENDKFGDIDYNNGVVSVFVFNDSKEKEVKLLKYNISKQDFSETIYEFSNVADIREITYGGSDCVYYIDKAAQLYIIENDVHKKIDLKYENREKIIPCIDTGISVDEDGNLYFTDGYNFEFYKYDKNAKKIQKVYERTEKISSSIQFNDIRKLEYKGGMLTAVSPSLFTAAFEDIEPFYVSIDEKGNEIVIRNKIVKETELIKKGIICLIVIFIVLSAVFLAVYLIIYAVKRSRSLMVKQVLIIIPLTIIISVVILYSLNNKIFSVIENEAYSQLYIMVSSAIRNIDVQEFENMDFPQLKNSEYYKKINETINLSMDEFEEIFSDAIEKNLYYSMYFIKDGYSYLALESYEDEAEEQQDGMREEIFAAIDNEWYKFENIQNHTFVNAGDKDDWFYYARIITNDKSDIVGYLEIGLDKYSFEKEAEKICAEVSIFVICLVLVAMILILLTLQKSLRSLRTLKKGVVALTDGKWTTTVDINTNDEIEDIGNSFNRMSYRISKYLESIVKLNEAYEKFVPNELFKLLGKENVLEVKLGDQKVRNMSIISVSAKNSESLSLNIDERFEFINKFFDGIVTEINQSSGIIEQFKGNGLRAVYTKEEDTVLDAALKIVEKLKNEEIAVGISIQNEQAVLGVVGNEQSLDVTLVSDNENFVYLLNKFIQKNKLNLVITGEVYDKINNKEKYNFRYIGKFTDDSSLEKVIDIYDVSDSYDIEIKKNRIITKEIFEKGVNNYISGNLVQARKEIIDVIRIDNTDEIAKMYLFLCDKYINMPLDNWNGIINI